MVKQNPMKLGDAALKNMSVDRFIAKYTEYMRHHQLTRDMLPVTVRNGYDVKVYLRSLPRGD